jgi:hypothetical protein
METLPFDVLVHLLPFLVPSRRRSVRFVNRRWLRATWSWRAASSTWLLVVRLHKVEALADERATDRRRSGLENCLRYLELVGAASSIRRLALYNSAVEWRSGLPELSRLLSFFTALRWLCTDIIGIYALCATVARMGCWVSSRDWCSRDSPLLTTPWRRKRHSARSCRFGASKREPSSIHRSPYSCSRCCQPWSSSSP